MNYSMKKLAILLPKWEKAEYYEEVANHFQSIFTLFRNNVFWFWARLPPISDLFIGILIQTYLWCAKRSEQPSYLITMVDGFDRCLIEFWIQSECILSKNQWCRSVKCFGTGPDLDLDHLSQIESLKENPDEVSIIVPI